jgi:hypothetical protein
VQQLQATASHSAVNIDKEPDNNEQISDGIVPSRREEYSNFKTLPAGVKEVREIGSS